MLKKINKKQLFGVLLFAAAVVFSVVVYLVVGRPMLQFVADPEKFRLWVAEKGWVARFAYLGMMIFQILIAIIPGEPLELGAGYAFGAVEGTLLCIAGAVIGSLIVFGLSRKLGVKFVELFFSKEKLESVKFLKSSPKRDVLLFILFVIPGTPKDLLSYFAGLTDISLKKWFIISVIGRIPSVVTSTVSGNELGNESYISAVIAVGITLAVSLVGIAVYSYICKKHNKGE